jgi:nucleoid DNA-binding protein
MSQVPYKELIKQIAKEAGLTQVATKNILDATTAVIKKLVKEGKEPSIPSLGKFYLSEGKKNMFGKVQDYKTVKFKKSVGFFS